MAETEFRHEDRDSGSIGIGAMIVFIALILVAAVASTIIIKTAEELQQNAENTSDDTRKQISGKVSLVDVFVKSADDPLNAAATNTDVDTMEVVARVSSGSIGVEDGDIEWYVTCKVSLTHDGTNPADGDLTNVLTAAQVVPSSITYSVVDSGTSDTRAIGDVEDIADEDFVAGNTYEIAVVGNTEWSTIDTAGALASGTKLLAEYAVGDEVTLIPTFDGTSAGHTGTGTGHDDSYLVGDELTAGTVFKFEIALTATNADNTADVEAAGVDGDPTSNSIDHITPQDFEVKAGGGAGTNEPGCDAEAGTGQSLELRLVVTGGGETLSTLEIDSLVLGSSMM